MHVTSSKCEMLSDLNALIYHKSLLCDQAIHRTVTLIQKRRNPVTMKMTHLLYHNKIFQFLRCHRTPFCSCRTCLNIVPPLNLSSSSGCYEIRMPCSSNILSRSAGFKLATLWNILCALHLLRNACELQWTLGQVLGVQLTWSIGQACGGLIIAHVH